MIKNNGWDRQNVERLNPRSFSQAQQPNDSLMYSQHFQIKKYMMQ